MNLQIDAFNVREIDDWTLAGPEPRGKREKVWVVDQTGKRWLRKLPLPARPFELAIEATTLRLARAAGLPAPISEPCQWVEGGRLHRGVIIQSFTQQVGELAEAAEIIKGSDRSYDPETRAAHTIGRINAALKGRERASGVNTMRTDFMRMVIFDAWIGNGDRHPANWGVIRTIGGREFLTPIYDTAACLGTELAEGHSLLSPRGRTNVRLLRYVAACPSGFGNGSELLRQHEVVTAIKGWAGWGGAAEELLEKFGGIWDGPLWRYFEGIPQDWLPTERRTLAKELLGLRLAWLRGQVYEQDRSALRNVDRC